MAYKMALVVRTDLGMGKGKIAAQCGHGVAELVHGIPSYETKMWLLFDNPRQTKIVLKVGSEEELIALFHKCQEMKMARYLVRDAGKTQVEPDTATVLAIGPDTNERIDAIVSGLKLL